WLDEEYHKQIHSGIEERPLDRYLNSAAKITIRQVTEHELDSFFLNIMTRKVKNDSTISVRNKLYEVPLEFIGKTVRLGFPIDNPDKISIYDDRDKPVCLLRKVNLSENATKPYTGIHFKNIEKGKTSFNKNQNENNKTEEKKND
ncbi:MAG: Mu transposase C-terminal domain-containing protein, partial [Bacteroidota bacterium]